MLMFGNVLKRVSKLVFHLTAFFCSMFSNGKFKNVVAETEINEIISPAQSFQGTYSLLPVRGQTKNWIAVKGSLFSNSHNDTSLIALNSKLACSTPLSTIYITCSKYSFSDQKRHPVRHHTIAVDKEGEEETTSGAKCSGGGNYTEKNVFAIQVSYYAKIKLFLSSIGGIDDISLKLPFILGNVEQKPQNVDSLDQYKDFSIDADKTAKNESQFYTTNELTAILTENTNDIDQSLDSSASDLEINSECKKESIIQAQIHERKYLESDM